MQALIIRRGTVFRSLLTFAVLAAAAAGCLPGSAAAAPGVPAIFAQDGAFIEPVMQPAVDREPSPEPAAAPVGAGWG